MIALDWWSLENIKIESLLFTSSEKVIEWDRNMPLSGKRLVQDDTFVDEAYVVEATIHKLFY